MTSAERNDEAESLSRPPRGGSSPPSSAPNLDNTHEGDEHVMAPAKQPRQRKPTAHSVMDWIREHPDVTITLDYIDAEVEGNRSSISAAINNFIERDMLPGLERLGKGIYRWNSSAASEPEADEGVAKKFSLVGQINSKAIVVQDSDGHLWRAERLR